MSPIEKMMLEELQRRAALDPATPASDADAIDLLAAAGHDIADRCAGFRRWTVFQEMPVDGYRVDFAIVGGCLNEWEVAVECDGHNFHERTADQAKHDRRRDRYLQAKGWRVMRFTGSEIVRDVRGCVDELVELLNALQDRAEREAAYVMSRGR
jgi:very-short-patch-repair endonuclease